MDRRLIVVILLIVPFIHGYKIITILSDFTDNKDLEFFKTTLPWIVENIGSEISLNFHFKDSPINSGPRKCYLVHLERNIYLQTEYLRCLAHGNAQDVCVEHLPIDKLDFKRCLRLFVKFFVKNAQLQFRKNKVDTTPTIILPRRKILTDTTPQNTMKNICSLFNFFWKPIGCIAPSPFPDQTTKPNEDMESTTTQQPNSEDHAIPEEEKRPNDNTTQKSVTKSEEEKQPNKSSTAESVTKPEEEKQTSQNSTPDNVTKTEEDKQTNESSTQENVTKTEEEKQPGDNVTPEGDTKLPEVETPTPQSEIEPEE